MAQHDYNISSADAISGLQFRQDVNACLSAIKSTNSGATAPSSTVAGMLWLDTSTTPNVLKVRNTANDGWVVIPIESVAQTVASAATTSIGGYGQGAIVTVTGTNTITSLGTSTTGSTKTVIFSGSLLLTHNATSLILQGNANITTTAGDSAVFTCINGALGYWKCLSYFRLSSHPVQQDSSTGAMYMPYGTTAQRPSSPNVGYMRFNTDLGKAEVCNGSVWSGVGGGIERPTKVSATSINVDSTVLDLNTDLVSGTKTAGTDYYFTKTYITSDKNDADILGGFHYGVIPENFTAINNITASNATAIAGINAYSIWTHSFRPVCAPEGMVHIFGRWYDIYLLNTDHHIYGTSAAGKTIAGGAVTNGRNYPKIPLFYGGNGSVTYGTFTWFEAAEIAKAHSKDLISYNEFVAIAYGVLEASSASTADTGITQHLANYTSKFGICMATGCQWIWGKDLHMRPDGTGLAWHTETEGRGSLYAYQYGPTATLFGGNRDATSDSGSRASSWGGTVWSSIWNIGCRFACDHLEVM